MNIVSRFLWMGIIFGFLPKMIPLILDIIILRKLIMSLQCFNISYITGSLPFPPCCIGEFDRMIIAGFTGKLFLNIKIRITINHHFPWCISWIFLSCCHICSNKCNPKIFKHTLPVSGEWEDWSKSMSGCNTMQKREVIVTRKIYIESYVCNTIDGNIVWYGKKWMKEGRMTHLIYIICNNTRSINLNFSHNSMSTIHALLKSVITPTWGFTHELIFGG